MQAKDGHDRPSVEAFLLTVVLCPQDRRGGQAQQALQRQAAFSLRRQRLHMAQLRAVEGQDQPCTPRFARKLHQIQAPLHQQAVLRLPDPLAVDLPHGQSEGAPAGHPLLCDLIAHGAVGPPRVRAFAVLHFLPPQPILCRDFGFCPVLFAYFLQKKPFLYGVPGKNVL